VTGLILVTHDGLGEAVRREAEHILGRPLTLTSVAISYRANIGQALDQVRTAIALGADSDGALVITDLPGATPHNLAVEAASDTRTRVVSGLNLPMLLKAVNHAARAPDALAELVSTGGHQGITVS